MQYFFLEFEALASNDIIEINAEIEIEELFFVFYENFIKEYFVQYTPELENTLNFGGVLNYCKFKKDVLLENIPYRLWVFEKKEILEFLYKFIKSKLVRDLELKTFLSFF